jgi:hypothetical protein
MIVNASFVSQPAMEHRELAQGEKDENVMLSSDRGRSTTCWCRASGRTGRGVQTNRSCCRLRPSPTSRRPEVAAAGHDRCIVPIKEANLDAWLNPEPTDLLALYQILDGRDRPFYEHRLAA